MKPEDYKHIRAWGNYLLSLNGYIEMEQAKAAKWNAPINAIYERNGVWYTADQIKSPEVRNHIEYLVEKM